MKQGIRQVVRILLCIICFFLVNAAQIERLLAVTVTNDETLAQETPSPNTEPLNKALIELEQETALTKAAFIQYLKPKLDSAYDVDLVIESEDKVLGPAVGDILEAYVELPVHATMTYEWMLLFYGFKYFPTTIPYHNNVDFNFKHQGATVGIKVVSAVFPNEEGTSSKAINGGILGNKARFNIEIKRQFATVLTRLKIPTDLTWRTTMFQIDSPLTQHFLRDWNYTTEKTYEIKLQRSPIIGTINTTLYQKQAYNPKDNYSYGYDIHNNPLAWDPNIMTIKGDIDTNKPGTYRQSLMYHYWYNGVPKEQTAVFFVTILEDQTSVELKDVSLYQGQTYLPESPFDKVTDKDGVPIKAEDIRFYYINEELTKELDTTKPGKHEMRLVIQDATNTWIYSDIIIVTVKPDLTAVALKDISLYQGETYLPESPFDKVTDKDGVPLKAEDIRFYYINEELTKELDTTKPGKHEVRIVIQDATNTWRYSDPATITVKQDYTSITAKDTSYFVGDTYDAARGFIAATDADGQKLAFTADMGWMEENRPIDMNKAGTYRVYYGLTNKSGQLISQAVTVEVKEHGIILEVANKQPFGSVPLGSATTKLYWQATNKVAVSDEGHHGWQLLASVLPSKNNYFSDFLYCGEQSFKDGTVFVQQGRGSQIVSQHLQDSNFIHVNYEHATTLRSDTAVIQWLLSPSIINVRE